MEGFGTPAVMWVAVAVVLVIVEMLTGTFYLLMLALGALAAAVTAWLGGPLAVQCVVAGAAALVGVALVQRRRRARAATEAPLDIDAGQTAAFEAWVSEPQRVARVRYRGAPWTARVAGTAALTEGALLQITAARGSTLDVAVLDAP